MILNKTLHLPGLGVPISGALWLCGNILSFWSQRGVDSYPIPGADLLNFVK